LNVSMSPRRHRTNKRGLGFEVSHPCARKKRKDGAPGHPQSHGPAPRRRTRPRCLKPRSQCETGGTRQSDASPKKRCHSHPETVHR
jgi:hypothetical protein